MSKTLLESPRPLRKISSIRDFSAAKHAGQKLVMVTAYDAWSARLLADQPVDCLLVGDSALMVIHGERDTLGATLDLMVMHTRAVSRGAPGHFIVADMPFLTVRCGPTPALEAATALMKAGAHAVKVEGLPDGGEIIRLLVRSGIPVMGHLGLTPQAVHTLGGFRVQGRDAAGASQLLKDAKTLAAAGVFAMVLECVPRVLARRITRAVPVPTIGIGAGKDCDGQVLVLHDLLGLNPEFHPRFARRFADGAALVRLATGRYASAVRKGSFPAAKEAFAS